MLTTKQSAEKLGQKRLSKKYVDFNVLLVGENGIGKKSFVNTLCEQEVYPQEKEDSVEEDTNGFFDIVTKEAIIKKEFPIRLTINKTKNFGFNEDNSSSCQIVRDLLDNKFEKRLTEENKIERNKYFKDEIIHLVILFVNPTNKGLKPLEIELIKLVQSKCNLIITIGKADLLSEEELKLEKEIINKTIAKYNLNVYNFIKETVLSNDEFDLDDGFIDPRTPSPSYSIDEDILQYFTTVQGLMPFSVINATPGTEKFNKREALVGEINIEAYSDFKVLREVMFHLNLQEFKDLTNNTIYERYRTHKLLTK